MREIRFPETIDELFERLKQQPDAWLMAGGTDLLVALRHTTDELKPIIALERIAGLSMIQELPDNSVSIGASTPFAAIAANPLIRVRYPILAQAAAELGGPAIRNMATIGGNIATASPAADSLPPLYLLDASLELQGSVGKRMLYVSDFISGPRKTWLEPGELVVRIVLPPARDWSIQCFEKVGRRRSLAIAVASLAAAVRLDDDNRVSEARFAWGSVGPTVIRCPEAEAVMLGKPMSEACLSVAADLAMSAVQPIDDLRASADYRRAVAGSLLLRLAR